MELTIEDQKSLRSTSTLDERINRLRAVLAQTSPSMTKSDWGNFGNDWGQGGGFDNFNNFENGY
jgi:hypothetical protein